MDVAGAGAPTLRCHCSIDSVKSKSFFFFLIREKQEVTWRQGRQQEDVLGSLPVRLPAVDTLKRYSKALEYGYRVKTAALDTLKRYSILSLTLYLE
jgi:sulfite reductase alpha subunit-like flavoprotein